MICNCKMNDYKIINEKDNCRIIRPDGVMLDNVFQDKKTPSGEVMFTARQMAERHIEIIEAFFKPPIS